MQITDSRRKTSQNTSFYSLWRIKRVFHLSYFLIFITNCHGRRIGPSFIFSSLFLQAILFFILFLLVVARFLSRCLSLLDDVMAIAIVETAGVCQISLPYFRKIFYLLFYIQNSLWPLYSSQQQRQLEKNSMNFKNLETILLD